MRSFFRWLVKQNYLLSNPASEIELPKLEKRLPRHVLSTSEAEAVLTATDLDSALGVRDRAMLDAVLDGEPADGAGGPGDLRPRRGAGTLMVRQGP